MGETEELTLEPGAASWFWAIVVLGGLALLGLGWAATGIPGGRLIRKIGTEENRPRLYTAHFSLTHACFLIAYPMAGWLVPWLGLAMSFAAMITLAALSVGLGWHLWPRQLDKSGKV